MHGSITRRIVVALLGTLSVLGLLVPAQAMAQAGTPLQLTGMRTWASPTGTRVVFDWWVRGAKVKRLSVGAEF